MPTRPWTKRRYIADHVLPHPWYHAICIGGDDRPVGFISMKPVARDEKGDGAFTRASMGYRIAYEHWGRGVATRVVRVAASVVFVAWPMWRTQRRSACWRRGV
jgi:RimJ/RimL family protein N-acetyltransferase